MSIIQIQLRNQLMNKQKKNKRKALIKATIVFSNGMTSTQQMLHGDSGATILRSCNHVTKGDPIRFTNSYTLNTHTTERGLSPGVSGTATTAWRAPRHMAPAQGTRSLSGPLSKPGGA